MIIIVIIYHKFIIAIKVMIMLGLSFSTQSLHYGVQFMLNIFLRRTHPGHAALSRFSAALFTLMGAILFTLSQQARESRPASIIIITKLIKLLIGWASLCYPVIEILLLYLV